MLAEFFIERSFEDRCGHCFEQSLRAGQTAPGLPGLAHQLTGYLELIDAADRRHLGSLIVVFAIGGPAILADVSRLGGRARPC